MNIWNVAVLFQAYVNIELPQLQTMYSVCQEHNRNEWHGEEKETERERKRKKEWKTLTSTYTHTQ